MSALTSEKTKMLDGEWYHPADPELRALRLQARRLTATYNASPPEATAARLNLLSQLLGSRGEECEIEPPFFCDYGFNIKVGERFYANTGVVMLDCAQITIGDDVMLGPGVHLYAVTHPLDPEQRKTGREQARPVVIGSGVWLAGGVLVLPGVTIGAGTVVGAGSVVSRSLPDHVLAAGNPCRILRNLP